MVTKTRVKAQTYAENASNDPNSSANRLINEISTSDSPYYQLYQYRPYNPTWLYQKKGSLDIYDEMRRDEQVKSVLTFKKYAAINSGWKIKPAESKENSEEEFDQEVAEFIERNLQEDLYCNFNDKLMEMMTALDYGYSVTEKVYELEDGKYYLTNLKTRAPHSFEFHTDNFGNFNESSLRQNAANGTLILPKDKFIIFVYQKEFDNWYGTSDLQSCYRAWFSKDIIIKFWNMYLERFGSPLTWGKYPSGARPAEINKLQDVLEKIQQRTSIVTPENMSVELLEATRRGSSDYKDAINTYNTMIARSMLVPDLLGLSKDIEGGSFSLGQKHFDLFMMVLEKLRTDLEEVIKNQLIKQIVDLNFAVDKYPVFKFNPINEEDRKELAKIWIEAVRTGAIAPSLEERNYLREIVGFPKEKEGAEQGVLPENGAGDKTPASKNQPSLAPFTLSREVNKYEKRVNFKRIDRNLKDVGLALEQEIVKIVKWTFDDIKEQIISKRIIENKDFDKFETIQPKYMGEFKTAIAEGLRNAFQQGRSEAIDEIDAVETFAKKKAPEVLDVSGLNKLITARSFAITGNLKDKIKKDIRQIVFNGIEAGDSTKDIVNTMDELRIRKYIPDYNAAGDKVNKAAYLEGVTRTAITDAFNQGRKSFFESTNVKDIMRAYEYSAILDETTSPICEELDGKVYSVNDSIWSQITPPNHVNCRSVLVPITEYDDYELTAEKPALISTGNPGDKFWTV